MKDNSEEGRPLAEIEAEVKKKGLFALVKEVARDLWVIMGEPVANKGELHIRKVTEQYLNNNVCIVGE